MTQRPSQRAQQKAETRKRLLEAATEVFIEDGPTTASLEKIAARAGVSRPTLIFHFGTRAELMDQVSTYHLERYRDLAGQWEPGDLRAYLEIFVEENRHPLAQLVWQIGDIVHPAGMPHLQPEGPNASYHARVHELERRMTAGGVHPDEARRRAVVLGPAVALVGRRYGQSLASEAEVREFVEAACRLGLAPGGKADRGSSEAKSKA